MICSGRTRRRRSCSPISSASSAGHASWSSRPTGTRRTGRSRPCSALSAEANTERVELRGLPAEAVGDLLLAAGLPASTNRPMGALPRPGATRSWSGSWRRCSPTRAGRGPGAVPGRVVDATAYRLTQLSRARPGAAADRRGGRQQLLGRGGGQDAGRARADLLGPLDECTGRRIPGGRRPPGIIASRTRWSVRRWRPG